MNAEPQNIEQANFEGRAGHFGVRMLGVLLFVIQPFFSCSGVGNGPMLNRRISNKRISKAEEDGSAFACSAFCCL